MRVSLSAPKQLPFYKFISREHNERCLSRTNHVHAAEAPYNEGMYRPIEIDYGPPGSIVNASEPAPHVACTTCPSETITDAVRDTLSAAYPDRATVAGWGHCSAV